MPISPEALVISSILRNGDFGKAKEEGLSSIHFYNKTDEFQFLEDHYAQYRKTASRFAFKQKFPQFQIRSVDDTEYFATQVKQLYARRMLTESVKDIADFIGSGDINVAIDRMRKSIVTIASETGVSDDIDIFSNPFGILDDLEARQRRFAENGYSGISTGIETIDTNTGGMSPGELWLLSARQGQSKSWQLQFFAMNSIMQNKNTLFFSLEQTRAQTAARIYTLLAPQFDITSLRNEHLMRGYGYHMDELKEFVNKLAKMQRTGKAGNLIVIEKKRGGTSTLDIAAAVEKHQPEVVFVDYIQRVKRKSYDNTGLALVTDDLTSMTLDYQIPIVCASQLNRMATMSKSVGTENLGGSDKLGDDATVVMAIKKLSQSVYEATNVKNRYGPSDWRTHLHFVPDLGLMEELTADEAEGLIEKDKDVVQTDSLPASQVRSALRAEKKKTPPARRKLRRKS